MSIFQFIDRERELKALEEKYKSDKPEFFVIYGRRRVGKTELIKNFCKNKLHIYYLCTRENDMAQLEKITRRVAGFFNERPPIISGWEDFFAYLAERVKAKRTILVIDEFPYLVEKNKAIPSLFQLGWDEYFKKTRLFLILCGSSIAMMERLLGSKSPLYGRRTGQIELLPLATKDAFKFFPNYTIQQKIEAYTIAGNIPMYLLEFDDRKSIVKNIEEKILKSESILCKEPLFLLKEELRDPGTYLTILENCTQPIKMAELATKTKISINKLPKYLATLQNLRYIKRITIVTEKKPKTKNTLYVIDDNLFRFWFRFVYPNLSDIEVGNLDKVLAIIKSQFSSFVGEAFEGVCKEFLATTFKFDKIGRWWGSYREADVRKAIEIDLIALNEQTKEILFAECKWQDKVDAKKVLAELKQKARYVEWNRGKRKELYAVFAKSFKQKPTEKGVYCFDLKDLKRILCKKN
jgi:AAA+ ATPase superfamily predicted ATPase